MGPLDPQVLPPYGQLSQALLRSNGVLYALLITPSTMLVPTSIAFTA
jgi:hypothetical protein